MVTEDLRGGIVAQLRAALPVFDPVDGWAVECCADAVVAFRFAAWQCRVLENKLKEKVLVSEDELLDEGDAERVARAQAHVARCRSAAERSFRELGMTPAARARLARDVGLGRSGGVSAEGQLRAYLERRGRGELGAVPDAEASVLEIEPSALVDEEISEGDVSVELGALDDPDARPVGV